MIIIEYEDGSYPWDSDDVTVKQAMKIEDYLGVPYDEIDEQLNSKGTSKLKALQAMAWLIIEAGNLDKPIADCDVKMGRLSDAISAAQKKAAEAAAAGKAAAGPDPTAAATNGRPSPERAAAVAAAAPA